MLHELLPTGVTGAARALGVEPMEVVRLAVMNGKMPAAMAFTDALVDELRRLGGIEAGWWEGVSLPEDQHAGRAHFRAALGLMLAREAIGNERVRMDNLWRGLPDDVADDVEEALSILAEEGVLSMVSDPRGVFVSVASGQVDAAKKLQDGSGESDTLSALWQG